MVIVGIEVFMENYLIDGQIAHKMLVINQSERRNIPPATMKVVKESTLMNIHHFWYENLLRKYYIHKYNKWKDTWAFVAISQLWTNIYTWPLLLHFTDFQLLRPKKTSHQFITCTQLKYFIDGDGMLMQLIYQQCTDYWHHCQEKWHYCTVLHIATI